LLDLFQNPARFFAHQRLGLALDERVALIPNREPMELDALEVHALGSRLVELEIAGVPEDRAFALVRAAGLLPHGVAGRVAFAELRPDVRKIAAATLALRRGGRLEPRSFEICCGERCLTGKLGELWSSAQLVHTYGRATAQRVLTLWIRHLALCASDPGAPRSSVMISRGADGKKVTRHTLAPLEPEQSRAELARLLELFFVGHTVPLRFFPQSALEYASKLRELSGEPEAAARALRSARQVFEGRGRLRAELADPAVERLFRDVDPFASDGGRRGPSFEQLATAVFGPCLERLESQEVEA
jgi:exodeoxyribonuclease V gamma subunit